MMAIKMVKSEDVLAASRGMLGLSSHANISDQIVDDDFLAAVLRHSAGFLCPCSAPALRSAVMESLQHIPADENLKRRIEDAVEGLTIGGDLLELKQPVMEGLAEPEVQLYAAPPGYIERSGGAIFLVGIVPDQDTYLPSALAERVECNGYTRMIIPQPGENLAEELRELGFHHISQESWIERPQPEAAEKMLSYFEAKLLAGARSGEIPNLELLDPERPVDYYRGRWAELKKQTGMFVGRRPQEYGAPVWCFVEVQNGEAKKLLDLPLPEYRWRGCDAAWHLQMAIDCMRKTPQCYRVRDDAGGPYLDFFSPLPLWAERRLMIIGHKAPREKCLLSFSIPASQLKEEESFLREQLWLTRHDDMQRR